MWHMSRPPAALPARGKIAAEELIPDPRGTLTPREIVELKLTALLQHSCQGVRHMVICRRSSRDHGPAQSLADAQQSRLGWKARDARDGKTVPLAR
jgi:hypothetical protein